MGRVRPVPTRTCVACRTARPKRALVRVVRAPDGSIGVDPTGKRSGRGAYLCPTAECLRLAERRGSLARALGTTIPTSVFEALAAAVAASPASGPGPTAPSDDRREIDENLSR
ncbi:MAG: hypothetical protein KatS3mg065_0491 [Chloroflexota bacterium]|nr:MAG: hypothetical protein KatS3mg065_0491 [Chloroflexota bacterium]